MECSARNLIWAVCDHLLVLITLTLPPLWFFGSIPDADTSWKLSWHPAWLLAPLVLAIACKMFTPEHGRKQGWAEKPIVQKVCLAVATPFLMILALEFGLAVLKFDRDAAPVVFESREKEDHGNKRVLTDPVLLFTFNPGTMYNQVRINSMGYREREIDPTKGTNKTRIICFGDSVTAQGRPSYSGILHQMLQDSPPNPDKAWEAFNMGVYGYSIRQGFQVFMDQGRVLRPDYVTIYFGMNDRNLHETTDKERMARRVSGLGGYLSSNFREHRVGKLVAYAGSRIRLARYRQASTPKVLRVPPDDYEFMLRSFVAEAEAIGCRPILITAARRDFSALSVKKGNAVNRESILQLHDNYNNIVRKVARETKTSLIDLARKLEASEYDGLFAPDGIHFDHYDTEHLPDPPESQPGLTLIARSIYETICREEVAGP